MKISATSALVLNWTDKSLWTTNNAVDYVSKLDLSEGDALLKMFSDDEHYMHTQAVSGRKYFVLKGVKDFLLKNENAQVVILGAGIAPISVEIGTLFPNAMIFDVDKFLMKEKEIFINANPNNIKFIGSDITDINDLKLKLIENGFDPNFPSIIVMEGITYYINSADLLQLFKCFSQFNSAFAIDFCIKPELVNENTRNYLLEVFRKIASLIEIKSPQFYSFNEMKLLFSKAGYQNIKLSTLKEIHSERTGNSEPFAIENKGWIGLVSAD